MAKKQTRRSVSISKAAYEALQRMADERGVSASSIVDNFVRRETGMALYHTPWSGSQVTLVVQPEAAPRVTTPWPRGPAAMPRSVNETAEERAKRIEAQRIEADAISLRLADEKAARRLADAEDNPCRKEGCRQLGLHSVHDGPGVRDN